MNVIQKYAIESLFARNQINKENLTKALESLTDNDINSVLSVLVGYNQEAEDKLYLIADYNQSSKINAIKSLMETFNVNLSDAKHAVDNYSYDHILKFPIEEEWNITLEEEIMQRTKDIFSLQSIPISFTYK